MAWTFILNFPQFFCFKNWCKITSRKKKVPWYWRWCRHARARGSNFCIFWAQNEIFSKSSFYAKLFSDPKYSFSLYQQYFFAVSIYLMVRFCSFLEVPRGGHICVRNKENTSPNIHKHISNHLFVVFQKNILAKIPRPL